MSLQLLAKQMESKGRGGDSVLVHMTHGEVAGLQKLAESAGGSLSVNPETGLVEANILKQLLPTIVGAGLMMIPGVGPMMAAGAGALVGGYQARRAGQDPLTGMITGGLGAYGGASLAGGLTAAGTSASNISASQAAQAANPNFMGPMPGIAIPGTAAQNFAQAGKGFEALTTAEGRKAALGAMGGTKSAIRSGLMALSPGLNAPAQQQQSPYPLMSMDIDRRVAPFQDIKAYEGLMPSYSGGSGNVYIPTLRAAQGGTVNMASGGAFEDIQAYESPMPNYTYQGRNIYTRAPVRQAPVTQRRPAPVAPVIAPPVQAPVVNTPITQPVINMGGNDGFGYTPNPDFDTPEKQAAYYAERPNQANIAGVAQSLIGMTPIGAMQNYFDPEGVAARKAMFQQPPTSMVYNRSVPIDSPLGIGSGGIGAPSERVSPGSGYVGGTQINDAELAGIAARNDVDGVTVGGPAPDANLGGMSIDGGEPGSGVDGMDGDGDNSSIGGFFASGGLMGLAKGGMRSGGFVIPADVVSMIGEGNTDAGYKRIKSMVPGATAIKGKDGGQSDTVKTSIEGKQPARVAHGEMYIPPETVKSLGGAKKLYAMMDRVRQQATGSKKQIKPVSLKRAMA